MLSNSLHNYITGRNDLQVKERKNVMCYGERFPLSVRDSSPISNDTQIWERVAQLAKIANQADRSNKQKQIMLDKLDKLVKALEEYFGVQESRQITRPNRYDDRFRKTAASRRTTLLAEDCKIPENYRRLILDSLREFEATRRCRESEAAYDARNPHKRG